MITNSTFHVEGIEEGSLITIYKQLNFLKFMKFESKRNLKLNLTGIYLLKVNKRNTRTRCEICSKLTIRRRSGAFIVNFEHISHLVLVFLLLTLNTKLLVGNRDAFRTLSNNNEGAVLRK